MTENPYKWYTIEDCYLCNSTGQITVKPDNYTNYDNYWKERLKPCPLCDGKGALKRYKNKLDNES